MTLLSVIIRDAFRESNLIAISADPTSDEEAEGLRLLNRYINSLFGNELGDPLDALPLGANNIERPSSYPSYGDDPGSDWIVPMNVRLLLNLESDQEVFLHPNPHEGARFAFIDKSANLATNTLTVNANGRTINGATTQLYNTASQSEEFFYRADTGEWVQITSLVAADESPFPEEFDDLLITGLAMRLNPRHGIEADPQTIEAFRLNLRKFKARYQQYNIEAESEIALQRTAGTSRQRGAYDPNAAFTVGWPYGYPRL